MTTVAAKIVLEFNDVTVRYLYHTVLEQVSLQVQAGEFLALVGPNGAGKTTLLKVALGLIRPDEGSVSIFGRPPLQLGAARSKLGYVPQSTQLDLRFPVSVAEVVLMGRYGRIGLARRPCAHDRAAAQRAMERVGITDLADRPIGRLSGGQRQRMFVARALADEPELLLLDEPTTGIDVVATESIYELLKRLQQDGLTIIVVSHDIGVVARYADSVACLNQRMAMHGRPEEAMSGSILACMYGPEVMHMSHGEVPHIVLGEHEHLHEQPESPGDV
jgi:zinc transport system ATP-binding protein